MTQHLCHEITCEEFNGEMKHSIDYPDGTSVKLIPLAEQLRTLAEIKEDLRTVTWADVLAEETAEAISETDPVKLRAELVQVAAVACRWIASLDRRAGAKRRSRPSDAP